MLVPKTPFWCWSYRKKARNRTIAATTINPTFDWRRFEDFLVLLGFVAIRLVKQTKGLLSSVKFGPPQPR